MLVAAETRALWRLGVHRAQHPAHCCVCARLPMRHGLVDGPHRFVCGKVLPPLLQPIPGRERCQDAQILSGRSTLIGVASGRAGRGRGANPDAVGIAWAQQLDGAADDSGGAEGAAEADAA